MRIAFYATLKSPHSPRPSGDRTVARLLVRALEAAGHQVEVVDAARIWSGDPSLRQLAERRRRAADDGARIERVWAQANGTPDLWFTYHNYHKAPDLLGRAMADKYNLPYVIAEASYAAKRDAGPWAPWQVEAVRAIQRADVLVSLTDRDARGLGAVAAATTQSVRLQPFLDCDALPVMDSGASDTVGPKGGVRLAAVAMMRPGDKTASYEILAQSLMRVADLDWHLDIVGDGEARPHVERLFANLSPGRLTWHGARDPSGVAEVLRAADLFVWPGVGEAFGMAYLEAQALETAVVACNTAGVAEVVADGETGWLAAETTAPAFAAVLRRAITDNTARRRRQCAARQCVFRDHSLAQAAVVLDHACRAARAARCDGDDGGLIRGTCQETCQES